MSAETASMSRWISRSSSMEGTTSRTRAWAAATPRPARSGLPEVERLRGDEHLDRQAASA